MVSWSAAEIVEPTERGTHCIWCICPSVFGAGETAARILSSVSSVSSKKHTELLECIQRRAVKLMKGLENELQGVTERTGTI